MSVDKFSKHQRSSKGRYVLTSPEGKEIFRGSDKQEFDDFRQKLVEKIRKKANIKR